MPMTGCMEAIYDGVQDLLDACLKDLKRTNKVAWEMEPFYTALGGTLYRAAWCSVDG